MKHREFWAALFLFFSGCDCANTGLSGGEKRCGDGFCVEPETARSCPSDCRDSAWECGNDVCEPGENADICPADCLSFEEGCGDGVCGEGETAANCPDDCSSSTSTVYCGNGLCEAGETAQSCPNDCSTVPFLDGSCEENDGRSECVLNEEADAAFSGEGMVGWSIAIVGDVDGDTLDDIVVGAPKNDQAGLNAGALYVIFGRRNFENMTPLGEADIVLLGARELDNLGESVAAAGDVNGDGFADFLSGAPGGIADTYDGPTQGIVYLFRGSSNRWSGTYDLGDDHALHEILFLDSRIVGSAGMEVAGANDVNGDGWDDFLIAAPWWSVPGEDLLGAVYLVYGQGWLNTQYSSEQPLFLDEIATGWINNNSDTRLGKSLAGLGDINGDGYADILMGTGDSASTRVYLVYGQNESMEGLSSVENVDAEFGLTGDWYGTNLTALGDLDADGYDDLLIGNPGVVNGPVAWLFYGRQAIFNSAFDLADADAIFETQFSGYSERNIAGIGDINGDGYNDLAISGYFYPTSEGMTRTAVYVFLGGSNRFEGILQVTGANAAFFIYPDEDIDCLNNAGSSMSGGGDVNGDGLDDFLIGASGTCGSNGQGYVYLVLGVSI